MPWIPIAAAAIGAAGSIIGGNSTAAAQNRANDLAAQQAAAQNQQLWNQYLISRGINPGNIPGITGSTVNTSLPLGATIGGSPADASIMNAIFGRSGLGGPNVTSPDYFASVDQINTFFKAHPEVLQEITDNMAGSDDTRTPAQWLHDHVTQTEASAGGGHFTDLLKGFAQQQNAPNVQLTNTINNNLPPQVVGTQNKISDAITSGVYGGGFLSQEQNALKAITDARTALANLSFAKNDEMRANAGNVLNTSLSGLDALNASRLTSAKDILGTQLGGLDSVLGSRTGAANNILGTELSGLSNIRGTQETGANNIYGAEMLGADTYENSVKQAVSRSLAQNAAARGLRGFSGDSSTDALMRARTLAGGYQQSGLQRAQVGVNLQQRLADARAAEAAGQLTSRSKASTSLGDASIQDALSRLSANTGYATSKGSANEQLALGQLQARLTNANALSGILNSDAQIGVANANLQNAGNNATLVGNDIGRQLSATGLPASIFGTTLNLNNAASGAQYSDLNALTSALGFFKNNGVPTPNPIGANIGSVLGQGQIWGSGLNAIGSSISDYNSNQNLINILKGLGGPSAPKSTNGGNQNGNIPGADDSLPTYYGNR